MQKKKKKVKKVHISMKQLKIRVLSHLALCCQYRTSCSNSPVTAAFPFTKNPRATAQIFWLGQINKPRLMLWRKENM